MATSPQLSLGSKFHRFVGLVTAVGVAGMLAPAARAADPPARPPLVVVAGKSRGPIRVDGVLDEPAWQDAGVIPDLVQQSPHSGQPSPYRTAIRVLTTVDAVFIGVECIDPAPELIALHAMQRDGNMKGDDSVAVVLDTFSDHTTAYMFRVNAAGVRQDGLVSGEDKVSLDWDGVWNARTSRSATGWSAEIEIPARTLRFPTGRDTWGFNVERFVARDHLTLRWAGVSLDARLLDLRRAGELGGLAGLRQGLGLSLSPFGLIRRSADLAAHDTTTKGSFGLDASYNLTSELAASVTVNTDFAETEADARQVNLTRFSLYYPEKRAFFLDGADQFAFGLGLADDFIPFFSRTIGLAGEDVAVPIEAGVKVVGRMGRLGLGVLSVRQDKGPDTPAATLSAGRVTYDVDSHLRVGAIATVGDPTGRDNRLVGVDATWRTAAFLGDKSLILGAWGARSDGDVGHGSRTGWGLRIEYPNDLWNLRLDAKELGDSLEPAMGFLPRNGVRMIEAGGAYQPRPSGGWWGSWVRQAFFEGELEAVTDLDGRTESWEVFVSPFDVVTHAGDHVEVNYVPRFERLTEPFEVSEGVVIPPGDYSFTQLRFKATTSRHRAWRVGTTVWFGQFYSGRLNQLEAFGTYTTPSGKLAFEVKAEHDYGYLPQGDFIARVWQLKASYSFAPDLVLSAYTQYDSESRNLGINTRLRWTPRPGTDLFVVWNHGWQHPLDDDRWSTLKPATDEAVIKLRTVLRW
jgi:hypothetical protein